MTDPILPEPDIPEVIANAKNTPAVRCGFEMGGYVKKPAGYTAATVRSLIAAARAQALEDARDACERIAEGYRIREGRQWPEMKSDAQTGASDCEDAIRAMKDKT